MERIDSNAYSTHIGSGGPTAPLIYVIDSPHDRDSIAPVLRGRNANIVVLPIGDWNASLTPWPAPRLRSEEPDYAGEASSTLAELIQEAAPAIERAEGFLPSCRAICGYSLAGLFSLYAFVQGNYFAACACLSGSVWYEGWVDYLQSLDFDAAGRFAFLSVGSREKNAGIPILRTVRRNMAACADILRNHGCKVEFTVGPGNHFQHVQERYDAGITALDAFME